MSATEEDSLVDALYNDILAKSPPEQLRLAAQLLDEAAAQSGNDQLYRIAEAIVSRIATEMRVVLTQLEVVRQRNPR